MEAEEPVRERHILFMCLYDQICSDLSVYNDFFPTIRFLHESAALSTWMGGARQMIDRWRQLTDSDSAQKVDAEDGRDQFLQFVVSSK